MTDKKIVVLIDAENTSAKYADGIIQYLKKQGVIISARIYGDFINNEGLKGWNNKAIEYEMEQKQQLTTRAGKNASDIALVIDAMDLLYQKTIDTFCIVTSDGDYTGLVKRIREDGIEVIGIGKEDASKRLEKVCDEYLDLEELVEKPKEKGTKKQNSPKEEGKGDKKTRQSQKSGKTKKGADVNKDFDTAETPDIKKTDTNKKDNGKKENKKADTKGAEPLGNIKMALNELIQQDENAGKHAELGGIKSRLQMRYPSFNERDYGYKTIRELIDKETKFEVYQDGKHTYVISSQKNTELENVCRYILDEYPKKVMGVHEMGALGKKLHSKFPEFNYKNYGCAKLSLFIEKMGFTIY